MEKIFKTKIDGVPVEIEVIKLGPATIAEINNLENNLVRNDESYIVSSQQINVVKVGNENLPATQEDINKVKKVIEENKDPATLIQNLADSIQNAPEGKDWWRSKVVWSNVIVVVIAIFAYFGLDLNVDPELMEVVLPVVLAIINLWFRRGTDVPLSSRIFPFFSKKK